MELREAVETAVRAAEAEHGGRQDMLVSEFIVIASAHGFDDDGEPVTQVIVLPDGGSEHRILGLLEHARLRVRADILDV